VRLLVLVAVAVVGLARLRSGDHGGFTPAAAPSSTLAPRVDQQHSIVDNPDGSISVTEGRVTFWLPTNGVRSIPTKYGEGYGAAYDMPDPSTIRVVVANGTPNVTGDEQAEAVRFMTPRDPTKWTLANWQEVPISGGKGFSVDMDYPDQNVIHARVFVGAFSTIAVMYHASSTDDVPAADHIWSSLIVDGHPSF
jgi:hypothetical protein